MFPIKLVISLVFVKDKFDPYNTLALAVLLFYIVVVFVCKNASGDLYPCICIYIYTQHCI